MIRSGYTPQVDSLNVDIVADGSMVGLSSWVM